MFKLTTTIMLVGGVTNWNQSFKTNKMCIFLYKCYSIILHAIYYYGTVAAFIQLATKLVISQIDGTSMAILMGATTMFQNLIKLNASDSIEMSKIIDIGIAKLNEITTKDPKIKSIFHRFQKYNSILNISTIICSLAIVITHNITIKIDIDNLKKIDPTPGSDILKTLWIPINPREHGTTYVLVTLCMAFYATSIIAINNVLFNTILIYSIARLKVLQYQFETYDSFDTNGFDVENIEKIALANLKLVIKEHQDIISYVSRINKRIKFPIFIQMTLSSMVLAVNLSQIIKGNNVSFNSALIAMAGITIVILGYSTNEIQLQSHQLCTSIYNSKWYERSSSTRKIILIVMLRCGNSLTVDNGHFGPLTNDTSVAVFKGAYSFTSFLSQTN